MFKKLDNELEIFLEYLIKEFKDIDYINIHNLKYKDFSINDYLDYIKELELNMYISVIDKKILSMEELDVHFD